MQEPLAKMEAAEDGLQAAGDRVMKPLTGMQGKFSPYRSVAKLLLLLAPLVCRLDAQNGPPRSYDYHGETPVRIPVAALGYRAPGELPAFQYYSLVGLHFVDATHLLFTFNTTALLRRDDLCAGGDAQRMVRAVVLDIPSGKVATQAEWKLYDFSDFLWSLGNGQFLLRRCSQLERVDATLHPTPWISLDGTLEAMTFSPDHSVLMVEEKPPVRTPAGPSGGADNSPLLSQQANSMISSQPDPELAVDFIRMKPLGVIARSHVPRAVEIPMMSQGFLEMMAAIDQRWVVMLQPFQGPKRQIATIRSICQPELTAISDSVMIAEMCPKSNARGYQAYNLQGSLLWQMPINPDRVLPRFIRTLDGAHFAIETLHASHPRAALDPISNQDIDSEIIDVFDTLTGATIASFRTTPVYTAGRNVDFSPDGSRLAILHDGTIEIYDLNGLAKSQQAFPQ